MLARVATFNSMPDELDPNAVDRLRRTIREVPGFVAGYHLGTPGGKALSIVLVEDADAGRAIAAALARRSPADRVGIDPDEVDFYDAQPF